MEKDDINKYLLVNINHIHQNGTVDTESFNIGMEKEIDISGKRIEGLINADIEKQRKEKTETEETAEEKEPSKHCFDLWHYSNSLTFLMHCALMEYDLAIKERKSDAELYGIYLDYKEKCQILAKNWIKIYPEFERAFLTDLKRVTFEIHKRYEKTLNIKKD